MSTDRFSYCADLVKSGDEDRYLSALFAPEPQRHYLLVLYAFNLEVAKTREMVREPMLGEIRLQWWREALEEIEQGTPRAHAVVEALADLVDSTKITPIALMPLIDARAKDLEECPFAAREDLFDYVDGTAGCLAGLALQIVAPDLSEQSQRQVSQAAGRAWALTGLARSIAYRASQGQVFLPLDMMSDHKLAHGDVLAGRMSEGLQSCLEDLMVEAEKNLKTLQTLVKSLPDHALPAILYVTLCKTYLKKLRTKSFDPFHDRADLPLLTRQGRLLWAMARGRV